MKPERDALVCISSESAAAEEKVRKCVYGTRASQLPYLPARALLPYFPAVYGYQHSKKIIFAYESVSFRVKNQNIWKTELAIL